MLLNILKAIGALIAAAILFLVVVVNFGTAETRLVCSGQLRPTTPDGEYVTTPAKLYGQVETYRWMIFWADHDAMIFWEVQPGAANGFGYYDESRFATPITNFEGTRTYGSFSSLSGRIYVETRHAGEQAFEGDCK